MIRTEIKTKSSIVRIHDEHCNAPSEGCISHLNQIVSNYYKRRNITEGRDELMEAAVAYIQEQK